MGSKSISIQIIIILLLNSFFIGWNFYLTAGEFSNEMEEILTFKFENSRSDNNFDWSEMEVLSEPIKGKNITDAICDFPEIAVENDKIYVVWADANNLFGSWDDWDIFYRFFDGNIWSEIQVISEPVLGQNNNHGYSRSPCIAVENSKIFVAWRDNSNISNAGSGDYDIFYRTNLTGNRWEDIQVISEPVFGKNFNTGNATDPYQELAITVENDNIYVVWSDDNNTNNAGSDDGDIFFRSNLTGSGWGKIWVISEPIFGKNFNTGDSPMHGGPDIIVENGKLYVVWDDDNNTNNAGTDFDIFYRYFDGNSWSNIQVISEPVFGQNFNTGKSGNPCITIENSVVHVAWHDNNLTNNAGTDSDIFYRYNLSGSSWGPVQVISEPVKGQNLNIHGSIRADIEVYNNEISVVWEDTNNTNGADVFDDDIFYRSNYAGIGWEDILVISEPVPGKNINTGYGGFPQIAIENGKIHVVWMDTNNTNNAGIDLDIHYRSKQFLGLKSPAVTPISGDTSTNFNFTVSYFHRDNLGPEKITVNINDIEYTMLEINQADTNYTDGKDFFFNIKNLNIETHTCEFKAYVGTIYFFATLHKPVVFNTPPKIITGNKHNAIEDAYYETDYEYDDIDIANIGQTSFSWSISTNANWLEIDRETGILNGTPDNDDVGQYWINVNISDSIDFDFSNFTLTVFNVNDKPNIITDDIVTINEDEYYEVDYEAIDVDTPVGDLIWTMDTNASWLEFDTTTAVLKGTPENGDVGTYWVNVTVSDSEFIDYSDFILTVININDPPEIITSDVIIAIEDEFYEVNYEAFDVDNNPDELFWTITTDAKWLTYKLDTASIIGTPANDNVGQYWINIVPFTKI